MSIVMGYENLISADETIIATLLRAEPRFFSYLKRDIKKQLSMMPEIEKHQLKYELKESKEMTEKIKALGIDLLEREFVH